MYRKFTDYTNPIRLSAPVSVFGLFGRLHLSSSCSLLQTTLAYQYDIYIYVYVLTGDN